MAVYPVTIDQAWLDNGKNQNPKTKEPLSKLGLGYLDTWKGAYRGVQVVQKTTRLAAEVGRYAKVDCSTLKTFDRNLGVGLGAFGFATLPSAASSAYESISDLAVAESTDGIPLTRKISKVIKNCADCISSYCLALSFIRFNPLAKRVADLADFIADSTDLQMSYNDYMEASSREAESNGEVKKVFTHAKNSNFYRLLKNIASVSGAILGLSLFVASIPAIVLITISLSSTLLGIRKDFIDVTGSHNLIRFDGSVRV